jgi:dipeptidyl aminopeptidase/acylaminoacyl peptidase
MGGAPNMLRSIAILLAGVLSAFGAETCFAQAPAAPVAAPAVADEKPPRIPTSVFAAQPFMSGPHISPDATHIVAQLNDGGTRQLGIIDVASGKTQALNLPKEYDLRWYRWAGNARVIFSVGHTVPWFDDDGYQTRLLVYDVASGKISLLGAKEEGLIGDDMLWIDPDGKNLLLSYQPTPYDYPQVYSIDIATNVRSKVVDQKDGIWDWYADNTGAVRAGFGSESGHWRMVYRASAAEAFHTVLRAKDDDDNAGYEAARLFYGSDEGYVLRYDVLSGRQALFKFNYATRKTGEEVFSNDTNDIDDYDLTDDGKGLSAAWYKTDRQRVKWFDPAMATIQDQLDKAVGDRHAWVVSRSKDDKMLMVWVGSTNDPGHYYLFPQADGVMHRYADVNAGLKTRDLVPSRYVHYVARDGLQIPAYLTLPRGRDPKGLPLIVMPHGGPYYVRDEGSYDDEVQFYANRGYVVLQPEYRGSDGYGKPFFEKGQGQWGRAMQDDLDDGMDWLVKQGIVDARRVCIIGSSYGGYAALWGAIRNPERYRCAASFAGVSDLGRQLKYQLAFPDSKRNRDDWRKTVQGAESFDLKTVSPLYTVAQLKVPVLLVHGDKDSRVPYKQSRMLAEALKAAGKTYEFYTLPGEGHGFSTSANEQLWYDKLDAFLAKYNPAD